MEPRAPITTGSPLLSPCSNYSGNFYSQFQIVIDLLKFFLCDILVSWYGYINNEAFSSSLVNSSYIGSAMFNGSGQFGCYNPINFHHIILYHFIRLMAIPLTVCIKPILPAETPVKMRAYCTLS